MTTEEVIQIWKNRSTLLRARKGVDRDGGMAEYMNNMDANIIDAIIADIEATL